MTAKTKESLSGPMQIAIGKALAKEKGYELEDRFTRNLDRVVDYLLSEIWNRHDLGVWSNVSLDGPLEMLVLTGVSDSSLTVSGMFAALGNRKYQSVPLMLKLEHNNGQIVYSLKVDRFEESGHKASWEKLYLFAHGELKEDWVWGYEVTGSIG